jgi:hypothetical protein
MAIRLIYGTRPHLRHRCRDITVRGQVDRLSPPLRRALCRLNGGQETPFYVEEIPDEGIDWVSGGHPGHRARAGRPARSRSRPSLGRARPGAF